MSKIWFTSDPHFGHYNIISLCGRKIFNDLPGGLHPGYMSRKEVIEEMDSLLIRNWNEKVNPQDEIYCLGDFAFYNKSKKENIIKQLNGIKYLVRGNHDSGDDAWWISQGFEWVKDYYNLRVHDVFLSKELTIHQYHQQIVLCHFPILSWEQMHHGSWHLHGHCHGNIQERNKNICRMDVGVDTNNLYPYEYEEIKNRMINALNVPVDHHK